MVVALNLPVDVLLRTDLYETAVGKTLSKVVIHTQHFLTGKYSFSADYLLTTVSLLKLWDLLPLATIRHFLYACNLGQ